MTTHERVRGAAMACASGGIGWFVLLMADVVAHSAIYGRGASYRIWEALLIVAQSALLFGALGLAWSRLTESGRLARIGFPIVMLGRTAFVLGEIRSFAQGKDDGLLLPIGAVLTTIGMMLIGIATARTGRWRVRRRWLPLATGGYPLVAMFPIVAVTGSPSNFAISFWGLFWVALGLAMLTESPLGAGARRTAAAPPSA